MSYKVYKTTTSNQQSILPTVMLRVPIVVSEFCIRYTDSEFVFTMASHVYNADLDSVKLNVAIPI